MENSDLSPNKKFTYEPQKDITAYEVSLLIPYLLKASTTPDDPSFATQGVIPSSMNSTIEGLDISIKRHFKELGTASQA